MPSPAATSPCTAIRLNLNTWGWRELNGAWTVGLGNRMASAYPQGVRVGGGIAPGVVVQVVQEPGPSPAEWCIECRTTSQLLDAMLRADRFVAEGGK
jgi:hypothetical protein